MRRWWRVLACGFIPLAWSAGPPADLDVIRSSALDDGFARASQPRAFVFPADHGPHPAFRHEWWYVTGNLESTRGERFGFELTFFRFALAPPGPSQDAAGELASHWRTRQVYMAHFAVTDAARKQFQFSQKYSRSALGLAGAEAQLLHVWLDDWKLDLDDPNPANSGSAAPVWKLQATGGDYGLSLEGPSSPPVLNGNQGLSVKSNEPGGASYYYSIPRIAVRGQIARAGVAASVHGEAWLDREWGSGALGKNEQGWDWFALQLNDGSTLMFYSLRNRDSTRDSHSSGTWVDAAGRVRSLASEDVAIEVLDYWDSPQGGRYPARWHVRVPATGLDALVRPVLPQQELVTKPRYWEGAVDVQAVGGGGALGRGYVELVGYAQ